MLILMLQSLLVAPPAPLFYDIWILLLFVLQVLYYLFRVEPFTTLSIQLQGGKFDHADRMFSDIVSTWNGVLEDMSDVKELVWCLI